MRFVSLLFALFSFSAMADLKDGEPLKMEYSLVSIYDLKDAVTEVKFHPRSSTSMAYYEGKIHFSLEVEGNTCGNKSSTFGLLRDRDQGDAVELKLLTGRKVSNLELGCAEYSKPTVIKVSEPIQVYKGAGEVIKLRYGLKIGYDGQSVMVNVVEKDGTLVTELSR